MTETLEQVSAFDYYFALGASRSLPQVAEHMGKSLVTIKRWSVKFNWPGRVAERDGKLGKVLQEQTDEKVLGLMEQQRQIVGGLTAQIAQALKAGRIKVKTIQDCERVFKMAQALDPGDDGDDDNMLSLAEVLKASAEALAANGVSLIVEDEDDTEDDTDVIPN